MPGGVLSPSIGFVVGWSEPLTLGFGDELTVGDGDTDVLGLGVSDGEAELLDEPDDGEDAGAVPDDFFGAGDVVQAGELPLPPDFPEPGNGNTPLWLLFVVPDVPLPPLPAELPPRPSGELELLGKNPCGASKATYAPAATRTTAAAAAKGRSRRSERAPRPAAVPAPGAYRCQAARTLAAMRLLADRHPTGARSTSSVQNASAQATGSDLGAGRSRDWIRWSPSAPGSIDSAADSRARRRICSRSLSVLIRHAPEPRAMPSSPWPCGS